METEATAVNTASGVASIKYDHETLSRRAGQLAHTLARRRADLALMRAEEATVALSLESAKHRLDSELRVESDIRAGAPPSPRPSARADFVPDVGLARALAGQLDVTRASVRAAARRRDELRVEIAALQRRIDGVPAPDEGAVDAPSSAPASTGPTSAAGGGGLARHLADLPLSDLPPADRTATAPDFAEGVGRGGSTDVRVSVSKGEKGKGIAASDVGGHAAAWTEADADAAWRGKRRSARVALEQSVLRVLDDGVSSRSSFRFDHAHIWRDATMPNTVLVDDGTETSDAPSHAYDPAMAVGVVTERIFEGVTCFTPTERSPGFAEHVDLMLDTSAIPKSVSLASSEWKPEDLIFKPDGALRARVATHFATLCTRAADDGRVSRIVAPRVALRRVRKLASDAGRRSSVSRQTSATDAISTAASGTPIGDGYNDDDGDNDGAGTSTSSLQPPPPPPPSPPQSAPRVGADETPTPALLVAAGLAATSDQALPDAVVKGRPTPPRSSASCVLSDEQFADIMADGIPARFHESMLKLLYSTDVHGISLRTLYNRSRGACPTVVAIRDTKGRVFGCYGAHPWRASATRYYGTGESFVFGACRNDGGHKEDEEKNTLRMYKWSRANSLFQFTSGSFLAIGGGAGSHFALWVDEDLFMGTTSTCSTFDSPPLTHCTHEPPSSSIEFKILALEVWGFGTQRTT